MKCTGTTRLAPEYAAPESQSQVSKKDISDILDSVEIEEVEKRVVQHITEETTQKASAPSSFWLIRLFKLIF